MLSHFLINGDDTLVFPAMVVVNCCFTVIRSKYFCYTAKVFIHMDVRGNPGRLFFINRVSASHPNIWRLRNKNTYNTKIATFYLINYNFAIPQFHSSSIHGA